MTSRDVAELSEAELAGVADQMRSVGAEVSGALTSELIAGGRSNLTYRLELAGPAARSSSWVLRMPPRSGRTPSAHDVGREFRVTCALGAAGIPVPRPVLFCEDESVLGLPFVVAEFVEGRTVQTRADLDALDDVTLQLVCEELVETLASLHAVDYEAAGLAQFGRPDKYAARQVRRWAGQWELVGSLALSPLASELGTRLAAFDFKQRSTSVVHGDYRIDNTLLSFAGDGPRLEAVVDWELSTLGDPIADVAMMCVYRHAALDQVLGSPSAWTSPRLPSANGLAGAYEAAGGASLVDWNEHLALGYFKLAVIAAGIDFRYREGATHGTGFDTAADAVEPLLVAGLELMG